MSIYSSSKVLPYVYKCVHRITGKIYIGSRTTKNQKLPSYLDFPKYKTSSKIVKPIFDEFDWHIVAEFFNGQDAYNFEQELIHEQWQVSKEMSLNFSCYYEKKSLRPSSLYKFTDNHRNNISKNLIGRKRKPFSEEHLLKLSEVRKNISLTEDHKRNIKNALKGKPKSESHKQNMRKPKSKEHKRNRSFIIDVLTPDGFVIENTTMKELCSQFNLNYKKIYKYFRENTAYKGFIKI